jgi:hypothetical protein
MIRKAVCTLRYAYTLVSILYARWRISQQYDISRSFPHGGKAGMLAT